MSSLSFEMAQRLLEPFFNRKKTDTPLSLAQRTLNVSRSKKIAKYVIKGLSSPKEFYIIPPIVICLDIPEDSYFEFSGVELDDSGIDNLGLLRVVEPTFWIPDGQHRAMGAVLSLLEAPGLVHQESFGIMLIPDSGGRKRRQIFLDTNQYSVKPSKSIISLFDHRDEYSDVARTVLTTVPIFEGRTTLEGTNVPKNSNDLFTMNSLRESCKVLLSGFDVDGTQLAIAFWQTVSEFHPDWKAALNCDSLPVLRSETLAFNALTLNALALVGNWQLHQEEAMSWIEQLDQVNWSIHNPDWEGVCRFNGRIVKNNITTKALATYVAKHTGKGDRLA
jgi:DNA sulfur modification protein DndB